MFDLSYSVKEVSVEQLNQSLNEIKSRIVVNEKNLMLVSIKNGNLHTLSELRSIINEICDCLIINNNQAAITLTNHLFENTLKQVLIKWDSQGRQFSNNQPMEETFKKEVKSFDGEFLNKNIDACNERGLISNDETARLKDLKNRFRNPFSHASYSKLFRNTKIPIYIGSLNPTEKIEEKTINVSTIPVFSLLAQEEYAKRYAFEYFVEIYTFINDMDKKLLDLYPDLKEYVNKKS